MIRIDNRDQHPPPAVYNTSIIFKCSRHEAHSRESNVQSRCNKDSGMRVYKPSAHTSPQHTPNALFFPAVAPRPAWSIHLVAASSQPLGHVTGQ